MSTIQMWAIRHIYTGHYLPVRNNGTGRGGSFSEPVAAGPQTMPRLHASVKIANNVLSHWLKGKYCNYGDDGVIEIVPQSHRKLELMEIVPITIEIP